MLGRVVVVGLALVASLLVRATLCAEPQAPADAQRRYDEARQLMQRGRYAEAAEAYRGVADLEDAPRELRAQALFASALMRQNERNYEQALATYEEVGRRFPDSVFARQAAEAAKALAEGGGGGRALEFRRRLDAALDAYFPAKELADRDGLRAARTGLEHAIELLDGVLRDFPDVPRAREVALNLGDAHATLRCFAAARADYQRAIELAREASNARHLDSFVLGVEERFTEATRALRRQWATRISWTLLAGIGVGLLLLRPWSRVDGALLRLGAGLALTTLGVAVVAAGLAYYLREYVDPNSPLSPGGAILLVALPGITGQVVALGFASGVRGAGRSRGRQAGGAAVLGALAALAVATCLVDAFELFSFLDSKL